MNSSGIGDGPPLPAFPSDVDPWNHQPQFGPVQPQNQLTFEDSSTANSENTTQYSPADKIKTETMPSIDAQDLAELQRLSNNYQPEVTGPLVGQLLPSRHLAIEYQNADPAFVRKTLALSPKYASYRTVRGDGNCGWRAVAFGFFELLLKSGDPNRVGMEHARIQSLNGLLDTAGFEVYVYEDFADLTFKLFDEITATCMINPFDDSLLLKTFNNAEQSDAIVTHFKFLTSAWMKTHPDLYQGFLERPVADYCGNQIESYGVEIDHVGLMALIDCLVLPAQLAVEIHYLDRSAGEEVNIHRFDKVESEDLLVSLEAPVLRLLYRPGHYDVLYKDPINPISLPFTLPTPESATVQTLFMPSVPQQTFAPTPAASCFSPAGPSLDMSFFPSTTGLVEPSNFRRSMLSIPEFQPAPFQPLSFSSTTFRNSPFNPIHFQSDEFQPEIYRPQSPSSARLRRGYRPS